MGLFDFFRKKEPPAKPEFRGAAASVPLEQLCYDVAYFILPHYAFNDLGKIIDLCTTTPSAAGPFYYLMACMSREIEPDIEAAKRFTWHQGHFDDQCNYLALEYPEPTPVDMGDMDPVAMLQSGVKIVLAPYYSVVLYGADSSAEYFILGQSPIGGGTTVRTILPGGENCNLGPGPARWKGCWTRFASDRVRASGIERRAGAVWGWLPWANHPPCPAPPVAAASRAG